MSSRRTSTFREFSKRRKIQITLVAEGANRHFCLVTFATHRCHQRHFYCSRQYTVFGNPPAELLPRAEALQVKADVVESKHKGEQSCSVRMLSGKRVEVVFYSVSAHRDAVIAGIKPREPEAIEVRRFSTSPVWEVLRELRLRVLSVRSFSFLLTGSLQLSMDKRFTLFRIFRREANAMRNSKAQTIKAVCDSRLAAEASSINPTGSPKHS